MIVAFSTSSRMASTAIIDQSGKVLWSAREEAAQAASGACVRQLQEGLSALGISLPEVKLFAADLGPGSFTGVRVGVTLAKSFAYTVGARTAGADAFDLIDPRRTVVFPSKRGEWFVRVPGSSPYRTEVMPAGDFVGFGLSVEDQVFPDAARFAPLIKQLATLSPEELVPAYLIEPSISIPKKPYGAEIGR